MERPEAEKCCCRRELAQSLVQDPPRAGQQRPVSVGQRWGKIEWGVAQIHTSDPEAHFGKGQESPVSRTGRGVKWAWRGRAATHEDNVGRDQRWVFLFFISFW